MANTSGLLRPVQPGEVRNPKGNNQYTYRREAERDLARWCRKHGRELIEKLLDEAKAGRSWAMKIAIERILPVVQEHRVHLPDVDDASIEAALDRFLAAQEGGVPAKPNGNGAAAS